LTSFPNALLARPGLDVEALVALITDDAWVRMPPLPFVPRHSFFMRPTRTGGESPGWCPSGRNGQLAWGEYVRDPVANGLHLVGIVVIGIAGDRICGITHFETAIARYFGLPRTLN
jgi:RNA polymerase sigma-70 factor (ECF subfamily)